MTEPKTFSQEEVNELLGKIRIETRDRTKREFDAELEKQRGKAEEAKLVENQEFKELAEKLGTQVKDLESYKEQVGKYLETMQGVLDFQLKDMSDEAKAAVESLPGDVTVKLDWLNKHRALLEIQEGDGVGSPSSGTRSGGPKKSKFQVKSGI